VLRLQAPQPPTTIDATDGMNNSIAMDAEKDGSTHLQAHHHVDSELECRIVRKLDLRVIPLVSALCTNFLIHQHQTRG
jgi:hypothetical protein